MLYRPKFCSPAWTAEQKCFKYIKNGTYSFSCICDGNEIIDKVGLKLYDINYYATNPKYRQDYLQNSDKDEKASTLFTLTTSNGIDILSIYDSIYFLDNKFEALPLNDLSGIVLKEIIFCNPYIEYENKEQGDQVVIYPKFQYNTNIDKIVFKDTKRPTFSLTYNSNDKKYQISSLSPIQLTSDNIISDLSFFKNNNNNWKNKKVLFLFDYKTDLTVTPVSIEKYPINENGQYNLIEYPWTSSKNFTGEFYWQLELYNSAGVITPSAKEKTAIVLLEDDKSFYNLDFKFSQNTCTVTQTEKLFLEYPIQYWYYIITDDNNTVYTSKKIFSQKIGFTYDNLVNNTKYNIQIVIIDTLNNKTVINEEHNCSYKISNSTANFSTQTLMGNSGILVNWDNLIIGEAYSARGELPIKTFNFFKDDNSYSSNIYHFENEEDRLLLDDINAQSHGFYGCFRLEDSGTFSIAINYLTGKVNEKLTFTQSKLTELGPWNLLLNNETIIEDIVLGSWYIFYYRTTDSQCFIKTIVPNQNDLSIVGYTKVGSVLTTKCSYSDNNTAADILNNSEVIYRDITFTGKKVDLAYFFIPTNDSGDIYSKLSNINYKPYWEKGICDFTEEYEPTKETTFLTSLNFERQEPNGQEKNPLIIGDIAAKGSVDNAQIKRLDNNGKMLTIANIPNITNSTAINLIDLGAVSNKDYEYYLYLRNNNNEYVSTLIAQTTANALWDRWVLYICDETDTENIYTLDKAYLFGLNLSSGSMKNNNKRTVIENFTPYPRVQSSCSNYWSGKLSGLLGYIDSDLMTYIQTPEMLNDLKMLSFNTKKKFLKDRDGNLFEVELSNSIDVGNTDNLTIDLKTKTIEWVEIGDASDVSIVIIEQDKIENAVENKEIMG